MMHGKWAKRLAGVSACLIGVAALTGCQTDGGVVGAAQSAVTNALEAVDSRNLQVAEAKTLTSASYGDYIHAEAGKKAKHVRFAYGGRYFAAIFPGADKAPAKVGVWRVDADGKTALQGSLTFEPGFKFDLDEDLAVNPDGRYVAMIEKRRNSSGGPMYVRIVDVRSGASDSARIFKDDAKQTHACGIDFSGDARSLVACALRDAPYRPNTITFSAQRPAVFKFSVNEGRLREQASNWVKGPDLSTKGARGLRTIADGASMQFLVTDNYNEYDGSGNIRSSNVRDSVYKLDVPAFTVTELVRESPRFSDSATASATVLGGGRVVMGGDKLAFLKFDKPNPGKPTLTIDVGVGKFMGGARRDGTLVPAVSKNAFEAYYSWGGRFARVGRWSRDGVLAAAFHHDTNELIVVTGDAVTSETIPDDLLEASRLLADGLEMWGGGFSKAGADTLIRSVEKNLAASIGAVGGGSAENVVWLAHRVSRGDLDVDFADMGRTLLAFIKATESYAPGVWLRVESERDSANRMKIKKFLITEHPLEAAGARVGDVIEAVNGVPLGTFDDADATLSRVLSGVGHWQPVQVTLSRAGVSKTYTMKGVPRLKTPLQMNYAALAYTHFTLLAVQAGHTGIARQGLATYRNFIDEHSKRTGYFRTAEGDASARMANLLEGVIVAAERDAEAGYSTILANGGLKQDKGNTTIWTLFEMPAATAPLFADKKKLAYLTGKDVKDIKTPKPEWLNPKPVPYPDMHGNMIDPTGTLPAAVSSPAPAATAPAPVTVPVGKVLD